MEAGGQKNLWSCALPSTEETDQQGAAGAPHTPRGAHPLQAVDGPVRHCQAWQGQQGPQFAMQLAPAEDTMLTHTI